MAHLLTEYDKTQLAGAVVALMTASDVHRSWTVMDLERLIFPPIWLEQVYVFADEGLRGFFTWANLTEEAERGYLDRTRLLQPDDWNAGDFSRIWVIDGIALDGGLLGMAKTIRRDLSARSEREGWPARNAKWARGRPVQHVGEVHGSFLAA